MSTNFVQCTSCDGSGRSGSLSSSGGHGRVTFSVASEAEPGSTYSPGCYWPSAHARVLLLEAHADVVDP